MKYGDCIANLKMIKIMLDDNEQADVIAEAIDMAILCVENNRRETEYILKMMEIDKE